MESEIGEMKKRLTLIMIIICAFTLSGTVFASPVTFDSVIIWIQNSSTSLQRGLYWWSDAYGNLENLYRPDSGSESFHIYGTSSVPIPSTFLLLAFGLIGLVGIRRNFKN
jgi:hypothetical protein